jgi:glutamyl-tRNA reductase
VTSIVNSAEENRANFCKGLEGKPLFSALYGMYTVTLNELKAVSAQAKHSVRANKTSSEPTIEDDEFQEVKRSKSQNSMETHSQPRSRLKQSQHQQLSRCLKHQCQQSTTSHLLKLLRWTRRLLEQRTRYRNGGSQKIR